MKEILMSTSSSADQLDYEKYTTEPWTIINSYFNGRTRQRLVRHQVESYNDFVNCRIPKTINMFNDVCIHSEQDYVPELDKYKLELFVSFSNFRVHRPQIHENNGATKLMFPNEARLRNFTYSAIMTVDIDIKYVIRNGEKLENQHVIHKTLSEIHIGKLPIMLKSSICVLEQYKHISAQSSGECSMDVGGYFIINGSEKTCLAQERAAENRVQCFKISKHNTKWSCYAEIKSVPDTKCISPKQIVMFVATKNNGFGNGIFIQIPRIKNPIPLFVVFRAYGIISDKDICKHIVLDVDEDKNKALLFALRASIVEAQKYLTKEEAIQVIVNSAMFTPLNMDKATGERKKYEFTINVLENDLYPHCKTAQHKNLLFRIYGKQATCV